MDTPIQKNVFHEAIMQCLNSISIFSDLSAKELEMTAEHMHVLRVAQGGVVFNEGDPGDFVCFVVDGTLDVVKTTDNGAERLIAELTNGSSIGEMAVIGNFQRSATVKSHSDATLLTLTRDRLNQICDEHPRVGVKILRAIAQLLSVHLRSTSENLSELMPPD